MLNSCEGKSVIVTGASKGIGKGIAAVFARHGAKVLVVARNLDQADACAAELRVGGRQVSAFVGDVTNRSEMEEMARVAPVTHKASDKQAADGISEKRFDGPTFSTLAPCYNISGVVDRMRHCLWCHPRAI